MSESDPASKKKLPRLMPLAEWQIKVEAAKLRVTTDRKLRKTTPGWVLQIANLQLDEDETNRRAYKAQVDAARQRILDDREAGRTTEPWVLAIAEMRLDN